MRTRHTVIDSPLGPLSIVANGDHVTGLYFRHHRPRPAADALGRYVLPDADVLRARTATQVDEYLRGCRHHFDLPTALVGDIRHRRVWELLSDIDYGRTTTYGELAAELADGTTAYEVGQIVGRNPISIVLPCHRVVGKHGKLTEYAADCCSTW